MPRRKRNAPVRTLSLRLSSNRPPTDARLTMMLNGHNAVRAHEITPAGTHHDRGPPSHIQNHLRCLCRDHDDYRVGVASSDPRHCRSIDNTQCVNGAHTQLIINYGKLRAGEAICAGILFLSSKLGVGRLRTASRISNAIRRSRQVMLPAHGAMPSPATCNPMAAFWQFQKVVG